MDEKNIGEIAHEHGEYGLGGMDGDFWAWFAGFWEGEGSLSVSSAYTRMCISQVDPKPLDLIRSVVGGKLRCRIRTDGFHRKPIWEWAIHDRRKVSGIIERMAPFLRFRREKVLEKIGIIKTLEEKRPRPWSQEEEDFIKANWMKMTDERIGKKLGRSKFAIWKRRLIMGLKKMEHIMWKPIEDEIVRENWRQPDRELAAMLNRSKIAVSTRRLKWLGIKKYPKRKHQW